MTAVSSPLSYTVVEDTSNLNLLNPDFVDRKTLKLRLNNGMEVLLISDPKADLSAAAVSVNVGSWNDPVEYPGMAHFCEHMLFMGTEKYPDENLFMNTLASFGGSTNAFTTSNRTVYMFSIEHSGFLNLLDQFAHFFIDPLFQMGSVAREMHAVDQEFAKNVENDSWRWLMVFKETGNQQHPNALFSIGNSETLGSIPDTALREWHKKFYGAEKMHLAIYSSLPISTMKEAIIHAFEEVPRSCSPISECSECLSSDLQKGHIISITPIKNKRSLSLTWELPRELSVDKNKPAELVAYAMNRGQKRNLYENLKKEQWIDAMHIEADHLGSKQHCFFQVSLDLTEKGLAEVNQVVLRVFEAIEGLKETGVPRYLFEEKNAMAKLDYEYQQRKDPFSFIMTLADQLAEEDFSSYPRDLLLAKKYDPATISQVLSSLQPENCSIFLMTPPEVSHIYPDKKEKWMGAEYAIQKIPDNFLAQWKTAKPNPDIALAEKNQFVPNNFTVIPNSGEKKPILLDDQEKGMAYYCRSEFQVPESVYHIHILSPEIEPTAKSACLVALYLDHLTDQINPLTSAAENGSLKTFFELYRGAIHLQISGFSDKAPLLLKQICEHLKQSPPTLEQFKIYVDSHLKNYKNGEKDLAVKQAKEMANAIMKQSSFTKKEKLAALQQIEYEDFVDFCQNLFEETYVKALFAGNITAAQAKNLWHEILPILVQKEYAKDEHFDIMALRLFNGPHQIAQQVDTQGNGALLLVDEGGFSFAKRGAQEIAAPVIREAFFNELRTKQKTGYIASSEASEVEGELFHTFMVQSNSHETDDLLHRFELFIEHFNDTLATHIDGERFSLLKESAISSLKNRFRNLDDKSTLWNRLAFELDGDFDFVDKRIAALEELSYEDFLVTVKDFLHRDNRKRLAILYNGKLPKHFIYQEIEPSQISEIATYEPRR